MRRWTTTVAITRSSPDEDQQLGSTVDGRLHRGLTTSAQTKRPKSHRWARRPTLKAIHEAHRRSAAGWTRRIWCYDFTHLTLILEIE